MTKTRKTFTIKQKLEILKDVERMGVSQASQHFGICKSSLRRWLSQKETLENTKSNFRNIWMGNVKFRNPDA